MACSQWSHETLDQGDPVTSPDNICRLGTENYLRGHYLELDMLQMKDVWRCGVGWWWWIISATLIFLPHQTLISNDQQQHLKYFTFTTFKTLTHVKSKCSVSILIRWDDNRCFYAIWEKNNSIWLYFMICKVLKLLEWVEQWEDSLLRVSSIRNKQKLENWYQKLQQRQNNNSESEQSQ